MEKITDSRLKKQYQEKRNELKNIVDEILDEIKKVGDDYVVLMAGVRAGLLQEQNCLKKELQVQEDNASSVELINAFKDDERIKILVGDQKYVVTRQNIEKVDSMLKVMISGKYGNAINEEGYYIIDYDDTQNLFPFILNYIRSGGELSLPLTYVYPVLKELLEISRFFCTTTLSKQLADIGRFADPGEDINIFASRKSGGHATVVSYGVADGASTYNNNTFDGDETASYHCNGCLIEQGHASRHNLEDFQNRSYRSNTSTGTCWTVSNNANAMGILIIDCSGEDVSRRINRLQVYQMTADGRTTHIRFSYHNKTSGTHPTSDDQQWRRMHEEEWLELEDVVNFPGTNQYASVVGVSKEEIIDPIYTRYVKIECRNDGRYQNGYYAQLRQIKAFSRCVGDITDTI